MPVEIFHIVLKEGEVETPPVHDYLLNEKKNICS